MDALKPILNFLLAGASTIPEIADFFEMKVEEVEEVLRDAWERGLVRLRGEEVELTEKGRRFVERHVLELGVHAPW